jgi:hypothetical protein
VASPSKSRDLAPTWTLNAHNAARLYYSTTYSFIRCCARHVRRRLIELRRRRRCTSPQPPLDPGDICTHCRSHGETDCSLANAHALGPCLCPNDHRLEGQTSSRAYHSLYCSKCAEYCYVCDAPQLAELSVRGKYTEPSILVSVLIIEAVSEPRIGHGIVSAQVGTSHQEIPYGPTISIVFELEPGWTWIQLEAI